MVSITKTQKVLFLWSYLSQNKIIVSICSVEIIKIHRNKSLLQNCIKFWPLSIWLIHSLHTFRQGDLGVSYKLPLENQEGLFKSRYFSLVMTFKVENSVEFGLKIRIHILTPVYLSVYQTHLENSGYDSGLPVW